MRISDWSSDVCSSDLRATLGSFHSLMEREGSVERLAIFDVMSGASDSRTHPRRPDIEVLLRRGPRLRRRELPRLNKRNAIKSEEHTSELQSLMRISSAVICLKDKNTATVKSHRHPI